MRTASLALALVIPVVTAVEAANRPDIISEGTRRIEWLLTLDAGPFASACCRSYVVAANDTVDAIAKHECGDAACVDEIRILNPKIDLARLEAGTTLILPPRIIAAESRGTSRPADGRSGPWVLIQQGHLWPHRSPFIPVVADQPLGEAKWETRFVAVPREKLGWILGEDWKASRGIDEEDGMIRSDPIFTANVVPNYDPTARIESHVTLIGTEGGRMTFDVRKRHYDKDRKLIAEFATQSRDATPAGGGLRWPLIAIAVAALLGLVGTVLIRRERG